MQINFIPLSTLINKVGIGFEKGLNNERQKHSQP